MAKIKREEAIDAALNLLNEVGLDGVTTRSLATKLGVESATLYWHFKNKAELLNEMSAAITTQGHRLIVPQSTTEWSLWLTENARSFRRALLAYRDGAKLHAGTKPNAGELESIAAKVAYLVRVGIPERHAVMVLYSMGQFTIGCVLEEQARLSSISLLPEDGSRQLFRSASALHLSELVETTTGEMAFEYGISLLLDGLQRQTEATRKMSKRKV